MLRYALAVLLLVLGGVSRAGVCPVRPPRIVGGTQGYVDRLGSGKCFVSIDPSYTADLVYRSYAIFDDGLLMVFSSYGEGENSQLTSAREFYFFPRSGSVDLDLDTATAHVAAVMANGDRLTFDPASAQIRSSERGDVTVSPRVDPAERGGVEFGSYRGLMLDAGFARGKSPAGIPDGDAVFRSAHGQLCKVKNRDVFSYAAGEHAFKFADAELSAWLKIRCPALFIGF